jgi:hypothetical protein
MSTSISPDSIVTCGENHAPTPEAVDQLADSWFAAKAHCAVTDATLDAIVAQAIELVTHFGIVCAGAENSRELRGRLSELMIIIGNQITVEEDRVQDFKEMLEVNGFGAIFANVFRARIRHEIIGDPEKAILAAGMPKRVTDKALQMFGRCVTAKKKAPVLKVKRIVEKPAKKSRSKKASA